MAKKFGAVSEEIQGRLQKLSGDAPDALAIELFDPQTIVELRNWLKQAGLS